MQAGAPCSLLHGGWWSSSARSDARLERTEKDTASGVSVIATAGRLLSRAAVEGAMGMLSRLAPWLSRLASWLPSPPAMRQAAAMLLEW